MFLLAFATQTFNRAIIMFDYATNTAAYAKNCENKAKPQMHCNGKCQMMKKLKQEEQKDQQNPDRKAEHKNEILLSSKSFFPTVNFATSIQEHNFPLFNIGHAVKMPRMLLRPPIA